MKILCIMHADFETPGIITNWAASRNHEMNVAKPFADENLRSFSQSDFLILMGGPQSILDVEKIPYLQDEVFFIREMISQNKPVLGFCLGAQLIGYALGAQGEKSPEKEVGVYPITLTEKGLNDSNFKGFPDSFDVIHWHNDMPGLPKSAVVLAKSEGCPRQIVRFKTNIYGFQCHLEITKEGMKTMASECPNDMKSSRFTQNQNVFLSKDYEQIHNRLILFLDRLTSKN